MVAAPFYLTKYQYLSTSQNTATPIKEIRIVAKWAMIRNSANEKHTEQQKHEHAADVQLF